MKKSEMAKLADGSVVEDVITLLSSPKRHRLLSGKGHKVPISELEGKVVGLYFYSRRSTDNVFPELKHMYKKLRKRGENFELVFICLHRKLYKNKLNLNLNAEVQKTLIKNQEKKVEERFMKNFKGMPWLAVPFSLRKSNRKLYDWFSMLSPSDDGPKLVIIRPGENIAHTHAMDIYRDYGIEAYPFSKSRLTDIEVARLKSLTLDSVLFAGGDYKYVIAQDGHEIPASHLVGKNILLFLITQPEDEEDRGRDELIYKKVIAWYNEMKRKDEAFEMIRVFYEYDQSLGGVGESYNGKMPWLEFPYDKYDMEALDEKLLKAVGDTYDYLPIFVAFGRDGQFITMKSVGGLIDFGKDDDCPSPNFFDDVHLYREVRDYIASDKMWSTVDEETGALYYPS